MANYHSLKNAAILTPTTNQDLGSDSNRYSNVFMSGNIVLNNSVVVTSNNAVSPRITSITYLGNDTAADIAGGQTITITGTNFNNAGGVPTVIIGTTVAPAVSYISSTSLTFTTPALSAGTYLLTILHSDGAAAIFASGISYSGTPSWTNAAGSLGTVYETANISTTLTASGDAPITYSVVSGTLPTGSTLDSSTGLISGTTSSTDNSTTYNFTIKATDAQNQDTNRAFSLTISPDIITWNSPADGTSTALGTNIAMTNFTMSATSAAGKSITYTANSLPTGLSITGANIVGTPTVVANTSTLITATASTTNRTATRTFNWVVSVANDTYFSYTTLLLNGETTVTPFNSDASTNSFGLTINGDTKPNNFNPYTPGYYSNYFDGTGDYLSIPSNSAFQFGTGDFTIECWFYDTGTSDTYPGIISSINGWQSGSTALRFNNTGNRKFGFFHNPTGDPIFSSTNTFSSYQWYHIAVTRSGTSMKMFVNGVQEASATVSASISLDTTTGVFIGSGFDASSKIKGYISNVRVVKGTAVYTAAFTPSTTPLTAISGTSLLTCQSNRFIDNSTNNFTITKAGDTAVSSVMPFTANSSYSTYGSAYFDGTGDYLTTPSNATLAFGSGDFCLEFWIYTTAFGSTDSRPLGNNTSWAANAWSLHSDHGTANEKYTFWVNNYNSGSAMFTSTSSVILNTWTHVAITRSGTSWRMFINGVQEGSTVTSSAALDGGSSDDMYIGGSGAANEYVTGYISDVRVITGTAVYTSTFTPSTTPLTAVANTSLLTLQYNGNVNNSNFIDNSNFNNTITRSGNATQGSFSPYSVTGWSLYTNGTSSYAYVPYSSTRSIGTGDFSIECWVYIAKQPQNYTRVWSHQSNYGLAGSIGVELGLGTVDTLIQTLVDGNSQVYTGATYDTSGTSGSGHVRQWIHVVSSRQNGYLRLFVNGVLREANASTTNINGTSVTSFGTNSQLGGDLTELYISNFRMCIGSVPASYSTTNTTSGTTIFTPPTSPATVTSQGASNVTLLLFQSNRLVDNSPYNFAITTVSNPSIQAFGPFGSIPEAVPISYSNYFDGTGDYLTTPASSILDVGNTSWTIECWVYMNNTTGTQMIVGYNNTSSSDFWDLTVVSGVPTFKRRIVSSEVVVSGGTVSANIFTHVAVVRNGTAVTIYLNGSSVATNASVSMPTSMSDQILGIGANRYGNGYEYYFNGFISNLRIVKGTAVYTSTFTPSTTPLTAIANTSLLTCQSTTMIDNSTNAFAITAAGNTVPRIFNPFGYTEQSATSYTPTTHGGSAYFDGTGDYLQTPSSVSSSLGTSNFTWECWIYRNAVTDATYADAICCVSTGTNGFAVGVNSDGKVGYAISSAGVWDIRRGVDPGDPRGSIVIPLNTWIHIALVRNGSTFTGYVNGVQDQTFTSSGSISSISSNYNIGKWHDGNNRWWNGYISNFRFVIGTAVYTSNFVPPTQTLTAITNTSLLLNFNNGGIIDQHGTNVLETGGNTQLSTAVKKYNNGSIYFDGTGDYLASLDNLTLGFGSGAFTVEGWVYLNNISSTKGIVFGRGNNSFGLRVGQGYLGNVNGLNIVKAGVADLDYCSFTFATNTWYHIAVVRSGTTIYFFVNGTQQTTLGSGAGSFNYVNPTSGFYVGCNNDTNEQFAGYIDDLRITKGYARYTSNFTAPTSALITK